MVFPTEGYLTDTVKGSMKYSGNSKKKDTMESHSGGKRKSRANSTITLSNTSLPDLNQEEVDEGVVALSQMAGILRYAHRYEGFIEDVNKVHGRYIEQEDEIHKLREKIDMMSFFSERETKKLLERNMEYERKREEFESDKVTLNDQTENMAKSLEEEKLKIEKEMKKKLEVTKKRVEDGAEAKIRKNTEGYENTIGDLNRSLKKQEESHQAKTNKYEEVIKRLNDEVINLKCDQKAYRTRTIELEREINGLKELLPTIPHSPDF